MIVVGVKEGVGETQSLEESPPDTIVVLMPGRSSKLVGLVRVELELPLLTGPLLKRPFGPEFRSQPKSMVEEIKVPFPLEGLELVEFELGAISEGHIDEGLLAERPALRPLGDMATS